MSNVTCPFCGGTETRIGGGQVWCAPEDWQRLPLYYKKRAGSIDSALSLLNYHPCLCMTNKSATPCPANVLPTNKVRRLIENSSRRMKVQ